MLSSLLWVLATLLAVLPGLAALLLWPGHGAQAATLANSSGGTEQRLDTRYFAIYYPQGEEQTARWYASFVDEVDAEVSELLGSEPLDGLTLRIFATEPDYISANPLAQVHPVVAHAIPERMEIGVAVERLRALPPGVARDSFRHEMTHVVAGVLSGHRLPVGFQEGLGQYNELSTDRAEDVAHTLAAADASTSSLLSWEELNDPIAFRYRITMAYPQSYTVMAFLAERYGMGAFGRFLIGLKNGMDYRDALRAAYGLPMGELEKQWHDHYLPAFLAGGWQVNVLTAFDMQPALDLYKAGRFTEAAVRFAESERLYTDLGRADRAAQASAYRHRAERAAQALDLSLQARRALERYDYAAARSAAEQAARTFAGLGLSDRQSTAQATAELAQRGLDAMASMQRARQMASVFNLFGAMAEARRAAHTFAGLGDAGRLAGANALLAELWAWQRFAGLSALLTGALVTGAGTLAALRHRSRLRPRSASSSSSSSSIFSSPGMTARTPGTTGMQEEGASWL